MKLLLQMRQAKNRVPPRLSIQQRFVQTDAGAGRTDLVNLDQPSEQWPTDLVDVISGANAVAVVWAEKNDSEMLRVLEPKFDKAARGLKKPRERIGGGCGDGIEVCDQQRERLAADFGQKV